MKRKKLSSISVGTGLVPKFEVRNGHCYVIFYTTAGREVFSVKEMDIYDENGMFFENDLPFTKGKAT